MDEDPVVVASTRAFEGAVFAVRIDLLRFADGRTNRIDVVEHPGSVGIVALTDAREIVLVRQYRPAVARTLWEIPAGKLDAAEKPLVAAVRELREETGYRASQVRVAHTLFATPGFCDEVLHFVVAEGLIAGEQALDEDERIEVGCFSLAHAEALLHRGEIGDVKTAYALRLIEP